MGEYPTAFALSVLYPKYDEKIDVPYWFYNVPRRFPDKIAGAGIRLSPGVRFQFWAV